MKFEYRCSECDALATVPPAGTEDNMFCPAHPTALINSCPVQKPCKPSQEKDHLRHRQHQSSSQ